MINKLYRLTTVFFFLLFAVISFVFSVDVTNLDYPVNGSSINMVPTNFSFTAEDNTNVSNCTLWADFSETWKANETMRPTTNESTMWNITVNVSDGTYKWNVQCFDNETIPNEDWFTYNYTVTIDTIEPGWINNDTNASEATNTQQTVWFSINWSDETALNYSIFSFDDGIGLFTNDTPIALDGNKSAVVNVTKTITATRAQTVKWKWYANDTAGNINETGTWQFTVSNTPPTHAMPILNATDNSNNHTLANLTCYNQSTFDTDGDIITNIYKWYKNDVLQSSFENSAYINSTNTTKNDVWVCEITPYDSYDYGTPLNSTNLTIRNSPPKININASVPASPTENIEAYIYANVTDDDNENMVWVNFTVIPPNGTKIMDNKNASSHEGNIWNSSVFTTSAIGTWTWNITAFDGSSTTNTFGSFTIGSWHVIVGNISGKLVLQDSSGSTLIDWTVTNTSGSNIYVADSDSTITFNSLKALTRNINGDYFSNDSEELDTLLNMTELTDSINITYMADSNPKTIKTFTIFGNAVNNVPITNSTNSSNFMTGILWDSSDDTGNGQFDISDKEDIVFITKVNSTSQGKYGIYDYEIGIPANLREYITANLVTVSIYAELK